MKFWLCLVGLLVIHTLDMVLTERCVGDNWQCETFLPMSLCIKHIGIHNSLWVSRLCIYSYLWVCIQYREMRAVQTTLMVVTLLYWASMYCWLYYFGWATWPG